MKAYQILLNKLCSVPQQPNVHTMFVLRAIPQQAAIHMTATDLHGFKLDYKLELRPVNSNFDYICIFILNTHIRLFRSPVADVLLLSYSWCRTISITI